MPKQAMNYANAVIYKIVCNDLTITDCYVGSTTNFTKRKWHHKSNCEYGNFKVYQFIRENGGWNNWSMILIEEYPTTSYLLLGQRERYWFENLNANLNLQVPSRTNEEWRNINKDYRQEYLNQNKDHIAVQKKQYYEQNREKFIKRTKQYYEQNKELLKQKRILRKIEKKAFSVEL